MRLLTPNSPHRAGLVAVLVWTHIVTVARAVRWPNDFAEAHWLLDYRFGFVKRGLPGSLVSAVLWPFGIEPGELVIRGLGLGTFLAVSLVLLVAAVRIIQSAAWSPGSVLVVLAFLSSPFIVMGAHLVGYFDHLLVLATMATVVLMGQGRWWIAAVVQSAAVLVHESALVFGVPIFLLAWLVARDEARRSPRQAPPAAVLALPVAAFVLLVFSPGLLLAADFPEAFSRRLAGVAFVGGDMHVFLPEWLAPAGPSALAAQSHRFAERAVFAEAYGLILPTTLALLGYVVDRHERGRGSVRMVAFAAAIVAPVSMHLAAWDTIRIWTYSIGAAFLGTWVYARATRPTQGTPGAVRYTAAVAVMVNVLVATPLLDGLADRLALGTRLLLYAPTVAGVILLLGLPPGAHGTSATIESSDDA